MTLKIMTINSYTYATALHQKAGHRCPAAVLHSITLISSRDDAITMLIRQSSASQLNTTLSTELGEPHNAPFATSSDADCVERHVGCYTIGQKQRII